MDDAVAVGLPGGDFRLAAGEDDFRRDFVSLPAGFQGDFRDGRDGRERLSAEAVGQDVMEVFRRGELGGGVALETDDRVVRRHARAVVDDLDEGPSGIGNPDDDLAGSGVDGVFHQFFHDGGGPLDDLSRRDHVRDVLRQNPQFHYSRA